MEVDSTGHSRLLVANSGRCSCLLFGIFLLFGLGADLLVGLVKNSFVGCNDNVVDTLIELADGMATDFGGQLRIENASVDTKLIEEQLQSERRMERGKS